MIPKADISFTLSNIEGKRVATEKFIYLIVLWVYNDNVFGGIFANT